MNKKILQITAIAFLLTFSYTGHGFAQSCENVSSRIKQGQQWIVNAQQDNGLFTYEYKVHENKFTNDDNIVRQVGTFWALIDTLDYNKNAQVLKTIDNFRDHISSLIIRSKAWGEDIAYIEYKGYGKINTAALYVLALLSLKEKGVELTEQEELDLPLMVHGMRKMSNEEGGFWYIYYLQEKYNKISTYGSGEAIYALAKYYDHIDDIDGLKWTYNAFKKYYNRYLKHETDFYVTEARSFFSWSIYGLTIINKKFPIKYEDTVKPLLKLGFDKRESNPRCQNRGCFLAPNIADAAFSEGMVQAYKMALIYEKDEAEIAKIREYITLAIQDFSDLQITDLETFKKKYNYTGEEKPVLGAFCRSAECYTIRNDLTQHALSVFMYYHKQFCEGENAN